MKIIRFMGILSVIGLLTSVSLAAQSSYSQYNLDEDCVFDQPSGDENEGPGVSGLCKKSGKPDMYFIEGDLRQSAGFGAPKNYESFGGFNNMNSTVEWRANNDGQVYAAIVRFFIDYYNQETGELDSKNPSNILVIHKVASTVNGSTCVVGMVDTRANKDANVLARQVADTVTSSFDCDTEYPKYFGNTGKTTAGFAKYIE